MKITIQDIAGGTQPLKPLQPSQPPAGRFDEFLEKAMTPQSGQVASAPALPPLQSISSLNFVVPSAADQAQTVKHIDEFLNIMESYLEKMADPKASLKDAYSVVQQMEGKTAELLPVLEELPAGSKLKEILNQALVASTVEAIKFNRGDYV